MLLLGMFCLSALTSRADEAKIVDVRKIWDAAPHNAFTDVVRFRDAWYCVFREGQGHVSPDGALRVLTSLDGEKWESAALIKSPDSDLRDAKISITPAGELMLAGAGALHDKSQYTHQSLAWFSKDGRNWSEPHKIGDPDFWLWRIVWHRDKAYAVGYGLHVRVAGQQVRVGSLRFMQSEGIPLPVELTALQTSVAELGHSLVFVAVADVLAWLTTIANVVGVDLAEAVSRKYGSGCPGCGQFACTCANAEKP